MLTNDSLTIYNHFIRKMKPSIRNQLKRWYDSIHIPKLNKKSITFETMTLSDPKSQIGDIDLYFLSEQIKSEIYKLKYFSDCRVSLSKNRSIPIKIYHSTESIVPLLKVLCECIHMVESLTSDRKSFTMVYFLTDKKKRVSQQKPHVMTSNEINSGCILFNNNTIHIWRKEDILRVTIHELMHLYNLELNKPLIERLELHYQKKYSISGPLIINEGYVDFWANIYHLYLLSRLYDNEDVFIQGLFVEIAFSHYQAKKIMRLKKEPMNQYTSPFSYYVFKAELFSLVLQCKDIYTYLDKERFMKDALDNQVMIQSGSKPNLSIVSKTLKMNAIDIHIL